MCEPTVGLLVDGEYPIDIYVLHVSLSDFLHGTFHKKVLITTEERKKKRREIVGTGKHVAKKQMKFRSKHSIHENSTHAILYCNHPHIGSLTLREQ